MTGHEGNRQIPAAGLDKGAVTVGLGAAQAMVDMQAAEGKQELIAKFVEQIKKGQRIGPAGDGGHDMTARQNQMMIRDELADFIQQGIRAARDRHARAHHAE
jgi:hypothetical protein